MSRSIFAGQPKPGDDDICAACMRPRHEHHAFEDIEINRPKGCKCADVWDWGNPMDIPPVCDKYKGDTEEYCETCEHELICHKKP